MDTSRLVRGSAAGALAWMTFAGVALAQAKADDPPAPAQAWSDFCRRLEVMGQRLLGPEFPSSERDRVEGVRHLARSALMGLEWELEHGDPDFPAFYRHEDAITRWGGPNVDNQYLRARIRGDATYRVRGNVAKLHDLIVSVSDGDMHQQKYAVAGDLDLAELDVSADGELEITLSPEPAPEGVRNWIQLPPATNRIEIRGYLYDWAEHEPAIFTIERVGAAGSAPAPLGAAALAARLDAAAAWVEQSLPYWNEWMRARNPGPPNKLRPPAGTPGGSRDILYGGGRFELGPDEALLVELTPPNAHYWSFQWYPFAWFESPDFAHRQTSLNGAQARRDGDGRVRLVFAHSDPGVPNWIDTEGRREGLIAYRYVHTKDEPLPIARVVKLSSLRGELPADTPRVTPAQRAVQLSARALSVQRRYGR